MVGLDLCPFAGQELLRERVRFVVSSSRSDEDLLTTLQAELELLNGDAEIETTLLIHPGVLQSFNDYNQFLDYADSLLQQLDLEGVYQIASFHPDYQFNGTAPDDAENYTNRSPFPMLHLLREQSLERALAGYPNPEQIPLRNIELMKNLGPNKLKVLANFADEN